MYDVFVSYSRRLHTGPARRLVDALVAAGYRVWFDERVLGRKDSWVAAYVTSRSSWGRRGLIIATATAINPGFRGTITLELVNHGNVPLVPYPGISVAQIIFHDADGARLYSGRLANQTGPLQPSVARGKNQDEQFWLPQQSNPA
jgi:hypothetical protein